MVIRKGDLIQFLLGVLQILQNFLTVSAVFPAQPVYNIQPGLNLLQFIGRITQIIPCFPQFFRSILHLIHEICHFFVEIIVSIRVSGKTRQLPLCFCQERGGTIGIITAVQAVNGGMDTVTELFRVLQDLTALFQRFILTCLQIGLADFLDLIFQRLHAAEFFTFIHMQARNLSAQFGNLEKLLRIMIAQGLILCECIQKLQMVIFIKQGCRIMLAVNIDKLNAKFS